MGGSAVLDFLLRSNFPASADQPLYDGYVMDDSPEIGAGSLTVDFTNLTPNIASGKLYMTGTSGWESILDNGTALIEADGALFAFSIECAQEPIVVDNSRLYPHLSNTSSAVTSVSTAIGVYSRHDGSATEWRFYTDDASRTGIPLTDGDVRDYAIVLDKTNKQAFCFSKLTAESEYTLFSILPYTMSATLYPSLSGFGKGPRYLLGMTVPDTLYTEQITPEFYESMAGALGTSVSTITPEIGTWQATPESTLELDGNGYMYVPTSSTGNIFITPPSSKISFIKATARTSFSGNEFAHIFNRFIDTNNWVGTVAVSGTTYLRKKIAGSTVVLDSVSFSPTLDTDYEIKVSDDGSEITVYYDDVLKLSATTTDLASTFTSVSCRCSGTSGNTSKMKDITVYPKFGYTFEGID